MGARGAAEAALGHRRKGENRTQMNDKPDSARLSRRRVLRGAKVAGLAAAAVAAETIARPTPALAGNDGDVVLGAGNIETFATSISNTTSGGTALTLGAAGNGAGLFASSDTGVAVQGAVNATGGIGVKGTSTTGTGVAGVTFSSAGGPAAVDGTNMRGGPGVRGIGGIGVLAETTGSGVALRVAGPAAFSRSGKVTIKFPAKSATVAVPGGLSGSSLVLALLQTAISGVFVASAVPHNATGKVTINLNKAPGSSRRPRSVKVAWFVVN